MVKSLNDLTITAGACMLTVASSCDQSVLFLKSKSIQRTESDITIGLLSLPVAVAYSWLALVTVLRSERLISISTDGKHEHITRFISFWGRPTTEMQFGDGTKYVYSALHLCA